MDFEGKRLVDPHTAKTPSSNPLLPQFPHTHTNTNTHTQQEELPNNERLKRPMSLCCLQENVAFVATDI